MKLRALHTSTVRVPLTRPYAVSGGNWDHVELVVVELVDEGGRVGYGQASPAVEVTGESVADCAEELALCEVEDLLGHESADLDHYLSRVRHALRGPAARAALDMALFDLHAKLSGVPVIEELGHVHSDLETSITIGLKDVDETLAEAREYVGRGFRVLKVKIGADVDVDLERLARLREEHGGAIVLRADANGGYDLAGFRRFLARSEPLDLEMIEQPLARGQDDALLELPDDVRARLVADESVHDLADLERMLGNGGPTRGIPFGGINVKLMKCGGIAEALRMAHAAERAKLGILWGCMDESVLGIAAALHAAYASRATRWLDLDGSLDLAEDPFRGGFHLAHGRLSTLPRPGFGVRPS